MSMSKEKGRGETNPEVSEWKPPTPEKEGKKSEKKEKVEVVHTKVTHELSERLGLGENAAERIDAAREMIDGAGSSEEAKRIFEEALEYYSRPKKSLGETPVFHGTGSFALAKLLESGELSSVRNKVTGEQATTGRDAPETSLAIGGYESSEIVSDFYALKNQVRPRLELSKNEVLGSSLDQDLLLGVFEELPNLDPKDQEHVRSYIERQKEVKGVPGISDDEFLALKTEEVKSRVHHFDEAMLRKDIDQIKADIIKAEMDGSDWKIKEMLGPKLALYEGRLEAFQNESPEMQKEMKDPFPVVLIYEGAGLPQEDLTKKVSGLVCERQTAKAISNSELKQIRVPKAEIAKVEEWVARRMEGLLEGSPERDALENMEIVPLEFFEAKKIVEAVDVTREQPEISPEEQKVIDAGIAAYDKYRQAFEKDEYLTKEERESRDKRRRESEESGTSLFLPQNLFEKAPKEWASIAMLKKNIKAPPNVIEDVAHKIADQMSESRGIFLQRGSSRIFYSPEVSKKIEEQLKKEAPEGWPMMMEFGSTDKDGDFARVVAALEKKNPEQADYYRWDKTEGWGKKGEKISKFVSPKMLDEIADFVITLRDAEFNDEIDMKDFVDHHLMGIEGLLPDSEVSKLTAHHETSGDIKIDPDTAAELCRKVADRLTYVTYKSIDPIIEKRRGGSSMGGPETIINIDPKLESRDDPGFTAAKELAVKLRNAVENPERPPGFGLPAFPEEKLLLVGSHEHERLEDAFKSATSIESDIKIWGGNSKYYEATVTINKDDGKKFVVDVIIGGSGRWEQMTLQS